MKRINLKWLQDLNSRNSFSPIVDQKWESLVNTTRSNGAPKSPFANKDLPLAERLKRIEEEVNLQYGQLPDLRNL